MDEKQFEEIKKKAEELKTNFEKKHPNHPHTIYVIMWQDGDFSMQLKSAIFDEPQHIAIRKSEYSYLDYTVIYKHFENSLIETEEKIKKNKNDNTRP